MSNSPNLHEPVCLLSRSYNSTVLEKYGSSQKGLRTRKNKIKDTSLYEPPKPVSVIKRICFWASKITKIFKSPTKETNIIDCFNDAHGISVPLVLHWMPTVLAIVFLVSSYVYKGAVTCMKILSHHVFSGRRVRPKSISSLNQPVSC